MERPVPLSLPAAGPQRDFSFRCYICPVTGSYVNDTLTGPGHRPLLPTTPLVSRAIRLTTAGPARRYHAD
jgi:hypothetical protein